MDLDATFLEDGAEKFFHSLLGHFTAQTLIEVTVRVVCGDLEHVGIIIVQDGVYQEGDLSPMDGLEIQGFAAQEVIHELGIPAVFFGAANLFLQPHFLGEIGFPIPTGPRILVTDPAEGFIGVTNFRQNFLQFFLFKAMLKPCQTGTDAEPTNVILFRECFRRQQIGFLGALGEGEK